MCQRSGALRACQEKGSEERAERACSHNRRKPATALSRRNEARPTLGAPKRATAEEWAGRGRGDCGAGGEAPLRTLRARGPPSHPPRRPQIGGMGGQVGAGSKRSLGCPVRPLPCFPKMLINLPISCPMARPGSDRDRTRGPSGARVESRRLEPRPHTHTSGGPGKLYLRGCGRPMSPSPKGLGNPLGRWPLEGAMNLTVTMSYMSRALEV